MFNLDYCLEIFIKIFFGLIKSKIFIRPVEAGGYDMHF